MREVGREKVAKNSTLMGREFVKTGCGRNNSFVSEVNKNKTK